MHNNGALAASSSLAHLGLLQLARHATRHITGAFPLFLHLAALYFIFEGLMGWINHMPQSALNNQQNLMLLFPLISLGYALASLRFYARWADHVVPQCMPLSLHKPYVTWKTPLHLFFTTLILTLLCGIFLTAVLVPLLYGMGDDLSALSLSDPRLLLYIVGAFLLGVVLFSRIAFILLSPFLTSSLSLKRAWQLSQKVWKQMTAFLLLFWGTGLLLYLVMMLFSHGLPTVFHNLSPATLMALFDTTTDFQGMQLYVWIALNGLLNIIMGTFYWNSLILFFSKALALEAALESASADTPSSKPTPEA